MTRRHNYDTKTTPIDNFLFGRKSFDAWFKQYTKITRAAKGHLVEMHKHILGPQTFCFTSHRRHWVWHNKEEGWAVFVGNTMGVQFQVPDNGRKVLEVWKKYYRRMLRGLKSWEKAA